MSAAQLAGWFRSRNTGAYRATVSVEQLAAIFIWEGALEGVRGDVAFCQSVLETGWFSFPDTGQVRPADNNFAGLGATDSGGGAHVGRFPDASTGVRAQIQHLRRYADFTASSPAELHMPLVDSRFELVKPPGKASSWGLFGCGNWASSCRGGPDIRPRDYGGRILDLFRSALTYAQEHP